jgi:hypothetical protein
MRTMIFAAIITLSLALPTYASAQTVDPCTDPSVAAPNSWFLRMNDGNVATKENMLASMVVLAETGFTVSSVLAYDFSTDITFVVEFNPELFFEEETASRVKEETLTRWIHIPGNNIDCNWLAFPAPAIGVRN